jgi:hypothetical protein
VIIVGLRFKGRERRMRDCFGYQSEALGMVHLELGERILFDACALAILFAVLYTHLMYSNGIPSPIPTILPFQEQMLCYLIYIIHNSSSSSSES